MMETLPPLPNLPSVQTSSRTPMMETLPPRQLKQQPGSQELSARQIEDRGAFGRTSPLSQLPGALPISLQACRFGLRIFSALPQLEMQASGLTQL